VTKAWAPGQPVHLETDRFVLRSVKPLWLAYQTLPWTEDPQIMRPLNYPSGGWSVWRWRKTMVHANNRRKFLLGIFLKSTGKLIGFETLTIDRNGIASWAVMIGDKDWWGQGVVVETRRCLLHFLFKDAGCSKVWGMPNVRNFPAVFNYNRLGFVQEGLLRKHVRSLDDEDRNDLVIFGLLRSEWEKQRGQSDERS
jgi:RimJ/RimL family protein N-acetyltransferase